MCFDIANYIPSILKFGISTLSNLALGLLNSFLVFRFADSCHETLNISTICSFVTANNWHLHYYDVRRCTRNLPFIFFRQGLKRFIYLI